MLLDHAKIRIEPRTPRTITLRNESDRMIEILRLATSALESTLVKRHEVLAYCGSTSSWPMP